MLTPAEAVGAVREICSRVAPRVICWWLESARIG